MVHIDSGTSREWYNLFCMVKSKLVIPLVIGVTLLIAGSVFAYYRYAPPKKEKKIVLSLKATPTPTMIPSPTSSPSATPAPIRKYIYYPTPTPTPTPAQDFKQVLNDYEACKQACPIVGEGVTCTENSESNAQPPTTVCQTIEGAEGSGTTVKCTTSSGSSGSRTTCKSNKHPDEACINSCKSKYGLNF